MFSRFFPLAMVLMMFVLSGCGLLPGKSAEPSANMVNPASAYCEEQGGTVEIRTDETGGQYGVCLFPDGSACDEWEFFRGECQPGQSPEVISPALQPAYLNKAYGFSFDPSGPAGWAFEEQAHLLKFREENYILWVQFYREGEDLTPLHTPDPDLSRLEAPPASLLGQELPRWLLVDQGKVKQVEYAPDITVNDLRLTIWLGYDETMPIDAGEFEMPDEIIAQADAILASFALTSGEKPEIKFNAP